MKSTVRQFTSYYFAFQKRTRSGFVKVLLPSWKKQTIRSCTENPFLSQPSMFMLLVSEKVLVLVTFNTFFLSEYNLPEDNVVIWPITVEWCTTEPSVSSMTPSLAYSVCDTIYKHYPIACISFPRATVALGQHKSYTFKWWWPNLGHSLLQRWSYDPFEVFSSRIGANIHSARHLPKTSYLLLSHPSIFYFHILHSISTFRVCS